MRRNETLIQVIGEVYDAATDPAAWRNALAAGAAYVGAASAGIVLKDTAGAPSIVHHHFGFDPHFIDLYHEEYWKLDPLLPSPLLPREEPTSVGDYVPHDSFREGSFYRDWLAPQGFVDGIGVVLERSATTNSMLIVVRDAATGIADDDASARMRVIAPHFRRAAEISHLIDDRKAEAGTFAEILDGLSSALFLIGPGSSIVHANVAGRALLETDGPLASVRGRLVARNGATDKALRATLAAFETGRPGAGGPALPIVSERGERYVAHGLPLAAGAGGAALAHGAVAALFVQKATVDHPSLPENVARHYELTPTELRVLTSLVELGSGPDVAEALGIGPGTVKTHLSRLFQKTGTHRQVDLVKLVAGFATPLLS